MAVLYPDEIPEPWAPAGERCFFCGQIRWSADIAVYWSGEDVIGLHVECAEKLGQHLIGDAREARLAGATGESHWPRRAARCLRESLGAQEMAS